MVLILKFYFSDFKPIFIKNVTQICKKGHIFKPIIFSSETVLKLLIY